MPSLLHDLAPDIRSPIKGARVSCPPLFRALAAKQLLQSKTRNRTADDDFAIACLNIEAIAVVEPRGLHNLARKPNGEVFPPFADDDLRHTILHRDGDIRIISLWNSLRFAKCSPSPRSRRTGTTTSVA